ncbi:S8 family serine peptidase [Spirulina sp. CCNP1310]|uniref:S8 family serine peptidase n=1 Tax=Spirulina sp. CCNP1310 TaxID=3110249 RepID=UPI002B204E3B|nr:S8 family serine peptidase [Spirulina sp. CCNP1310]MEA5417827.1 S8 family serine peptidase [Spirulina sp. CCNP1310]
MAKSRRSSQFKAFILEPILTPSSFIDTGVDEVDEGLGDYPVPSTEVDEVEVPEPVEPQESTEAVEVVPEEIAGSGLGDEIEIIDYIDPLFLTESVDPNVGVFTVDDSGYVSIDYLFDGGKYSQGELAIFSLEGMTEEPGSQAFIQEAARRALSNSELGYVVISDATDGARFSNTAGTDFNGGIYRGVRTFQMNGGDRFGFMLAPNHSIQQVYDGEAWRPIFSMATANPDDHFQFGQIADVTGDGSVYTMEDINLSNSKSDRDYNDLIFQVRGATAKAPLMDEVMASGAKDWRSSAMGQALLEYAQGYTDQVDYSVDPLNPTQKFQPFVGIIDVGFAANSPDLDYSNIILGRDWIDGDDNPLLDAGESNEQGTQILEIIAAKRDDNIGINGINPDAQIWLGRAINSEEWANSLVEFVDAAFESGQPHGVVNLSLDFTEIDTDGNVITRYELTPIERAAIKYAQQHHVLLVVAAGDDGGAISALGQASQEFDNILTVGAAEQFDPNTSVWKGAGRAGYSNYGPGLDLMAYGRTEENPDAIAGTSVAAAKVTGAVSQVWAANPELSYRQVIELLKQTATDLGETGFDLETAAGLLNTMAAVQLAKAGKTNFNIVNRNIENDVKEDEERKIALGLPDLVWSALQRAEDLNNYDSLDLASTQEWVIKLSSAEYIQELSEIFDIKLLGVTGYIPNTYVFQFPGDLSPQEIQDKLRLLENVQFAYPLVASQKESRFTPNDSFFSEQWHLKNNSQTGGTAGQDINVSAVWEAGLTGQNVVIGIVDDGLQHAHPDLQPNYRPDLSRDFSEKLEEFGAYDHDPAPTTPGQYHGTAVAGVAAAKGNNEIGITGVAPNAFLAGLRLTAKPTDDLMEADALSYLKNSIHIYNNSWGPPDTGNIKKAPGLLAAEALKLGVTQGRQGLGNIYVWAGGNGQQQKDNVNYDGYASSRYTIAVAAIDHNGKQTLYSEPGASLLVSGYSSGTTSGINTTDLLGAEGGSTGDYNNSFGGTSAAASLVSGVIALMLEANPSLTWRDVQKILIDTAKRNDPSDLDWKLNGGGYWVNHKYGFGAVDANAAVTLAKNWQPLGTEVAISSELKDVKKLIPDNNGKSVFSSINIVEDITIETVEVIFDADHANRGDLEVRLISPDGTVSTLAEHHPDTGDNYTNWMFTSTRHWGESSQGEWRLQVRDRKTLKTGYWDSWKLNFYGTEPTVNLEATVPNISEGETGEFTVTRTGNTKNPLTINYQFGQSIHWSEPLATNNKDFAFLPGTVTIPAGSSSVKIPIPTIDDQEVEWTEAVTLNLTKGDGYELGSQGGATVRIFDNEKPRVQLYAEWRAAQPDENYDSNYVSESGNEGDFVFRRLGDIREALTVTYSMTGTAINGVDYEYLPGSITFLPGMKNALPNVVAGNSFVVANDAKVLRFIPSDDDEVEGEETAILTINPSSDYDILAGWGSRTTTIWDNDDKPTVEMFASKPYASEYGNPGQMTISRTGDTSQPLTVHYWERDWWAKATAGQDYQIISGTTIIPATGDPKAVSYTDGTIIIPAGKSSVNIDIIPIDDNIVETNETVRFFLRSSPDYAIGKREIGVVNIADNDTPKIEWQRQIGTSGYDYSDSVTLDKLGNVYIAGRTSGNLAGSNLGSYDAWLAKYDAAGTELWKQQLGTSGYDAAKKVITDSDGNTYISGLTDGSFDGNVASRDAWLAKYGANGDLIWRKKLPADYDISNGSLTWGKDGSLYLAGLTHGNLAGTTQGNGDAWVAKYDTNGNQQWVRQLGTSQEDEAKGVAIDSQGSVYITGQTKGALGEVNQGNADAWIAKYSDEGLLLWKQQMGTQSEDISNGISIDSNDNIYIAGNTRNKLGDPFTGDPNELGDADLRWKAIHGDKSGLGGTYYGNADAWVAQYDSNGNLNWKRQLGTAQYDSASAVSSDQLGNVYITGKTQSKLGKQYAGGDDIWVAKYNQNGALQWIQQLGTVGNDVSNGIVAGSTGLYLTGSTAGSLSGTSKGGDDAWLIKLS